MPEEETRETFAQARRIPQIAPRGSVARARSGSSRRDGARSSAGSAARACAASSTARRATSVSGCLARLASCFDRVAIAVAGRKVHLRVGAGRILAQHLLDDADAIEEDRPVDRRQQPHAGDDVSGGELIGRLSLVLDSHQLVDRVSLRVERALERQSRPAPQTTADRAATAGARRRTPARDDGWLDAPRRAGCRCASSDRRSRTALPSGARVRDSVARPGCCRPAAGVPRPAPACSMIGIAQTSPIESVETRLIRGDEIDERFEIETASRVGDELARDEIDAWISFRWAARQLRQLDVVLARQVLPDLADLILHDVVVVAQPVLRSDRLRIGAGDRRQETIRALEPLGALVETRQERPAALRRWCERARRGQRDGVRLQLIRAERCGECRPDLSGFWLSGRGRGPRARSLGLGYASMVRFGAKFGHAFMRGFAQDARYAWRASARTPACHRGGPAVARYRRRRQHRHLQRRQRAVAAPASVSGCRSAGNPVESFARPGHHRGLVLDGPVLRYQAFAIEPRGSRHRHRRQLQSDRGRRAGADRHHPGFLEPPADARRTTRARPALRTRGRRPGQDRYRHTGSRNLGASIWQRSPRRGSHADPERPVV